jgi:hypothetical protein
MENITKEQFYSAMYRFEEAAKTDQHVANSLKIMNGCAKEYRRLEKELDDLIKSKTVRTDG